ncbi:ankryin [Halovibrio salipaludis]|uniref:Ankryin n=1 Tax=Halovibrio salipaludis TaxID=2032626 RepID=A0A2A2FBB3_9GAMM|nr:ankyrin repeat domain-containing protein [Halovibrio salipaludis]PAU81902.1 ankryin [Halovibrio salipaludis]
MRPCPLNPLPALLLLGTLVLAGCGSSPGPDRAETRTDTSTALMEAASEGDLDRVKALVAEGGALNAMGPDGTALYQAADAGHGETVWYLLRQGADPDRGLEGGITPLMAAAAAGRKRIIDLLVRAGADVNARSDAGETPLSYAVLNSQLGATNRLLRADADVNTVNEEGESLLMRVVARNDLLLAGVIVDAGAGVDYRAPDGRTALDVARANGNRDLVMMLQNAGGD